MTCNLVNNEKELLDAFNVVCSIPGAWTIFDYETNSNIIKSGLSGSGGLEELLQNLQGSKVQYGFSSIGSADGKQQKIVLIHWQGEAVPAIRLAHTASHVEEVRRFVKRVNCTVYARSEEDLDLVEINHKIQQLSAMAPATQQKSTPFIPPTPVGSVYKPVKEELELSEREIFWKKVQAEEEERRREEAQKREEQQKQFQLERKILEKELHDIHLSSAVRKAQQEAAEQPKPNVKPKPPAAPTLVGGRTKMFNQQIEEIAKNTVKTPKTPKQFKFEIPIQNKNSQAPINAGSNFVDEDFIPIVEDPSKPVAKVNPQQPMFEQKQESVDEEVLVEKKEEIQIHNEEKNHGEGKELRAITLWDYQADDSSEISFDSNEIISEIKKSGESWWTGRIRDKTGMFPANYVKLL